MKHFVILFHSYSSLKFVSKLFPQLQPSGWLDWNDTFYKFHKMIIIFLTPSTKLHPSYHHIISYLSPFLVQWMILYENSFFLLWHVKTRREICDDDETQFWYKFTMSDVKWRKNLSLSGSQHSLTHSLTCLWFFLLLLSCAVVFNSNGIT